MTNTRIDTKTGLEERFEYFGSPPNLKLARLVSPHRTKGTGVLIARSIDADRRLIPEIPDVSRLLAGMGHKVLRFDYRGQGQSLGLSIDLNLNLMAEDVNEALAWLRETASIETVAVLGVGLGGTAAAMAGDATGLPLALWEPLVEFKSLLHTMARTKVATEMGLVSEVASYNGLSLADVVADDLTRDEFQRNGFYDAAGFEVGSALEASARQHTLLDLLVDAPRPLFVAAEKETVAMFDQLSLGVTIHPNDRTDLLPATLQWLDHFLSTPGDSP